MDRGRVDDVLSRIRELLAQKTSLEKTGQAVGLGTTKVRQLAIAHQIPRRTRFSRERRRQIRMDIRQAKHTLARLAEIHGCSKSTMSRHASELTDGVGEFQPRTVRRRRVCGTCGFSVKVWPCVACKAKGIPSHETAIAK